MGIRRLIVISFAAILAAAVCLYGFGHSREVMGETGAGPVFVIDPGHGGEDGGAVSADGLKESEINLAIALRLDALLGLWGCPGVLTRNSEELDYPSTATTVRRRKQADLDRRVDLVNRTPNAVLLSIHQNKYPSSGPRGAQVFYRDEPQSLRLAEFAQAVLTLGTKGEIRPITVISDSIYLMRMVASPAILVECGFLSNGDELELLRSGEYQTKLALCLACACAEYTQEWERENGQSGKG